MRRTEYRKFRYTELQAFKDREVNVEAVKDELMDENMKLIRIQTINYELADR